MVQGATRSRRMALLAACALAAGCAQSPWKYAAQEPPKPEDAVVSGEPESDAAGQDVPTGPCLAGPGADAAGDKPAPAANLPPVTRTFQEGVAGYAGTVDLHLAISKGFYHGGHGRSHFATDPGHKRFEWDLEDTYGLGALRATSHAMQHGTGDNVGLLRFDHIFGGAAAQIPPGARILRATLELSVDVPGDHAALHRVLVPWDHSTRWSTFGPKAGVDFGIDLAPRVETRTPAYSKQFSVDVTDSVRTWSTNPASNRGWALMPVAAHSIIRVQGSAIQSIKSVRVHLNIKTPRRGEVVATLRHGDYTALLINRPGRIPCNGLIGATGKDFQVIIDQAAKQDIHLSDTKVSPLVGTFRPDESCGASPLCEPGGGGLCDQPADGDWILQVNDEWVTSGDPATVVDWSIELNDGVHEAERWHHGAGVAVPNRSLGDVYGTKVWSSEAPKSAHRPRLVVQYSPALSFDPGHLQALPQAGLVLARLRLPPEADAARPLTVELLSDNPQVALAMDCVATFAVGGPPVMEVPIWIGGAGAARLRASIPGGVAQATLPITVGKSPIEVDPPAIYRAANGLMAPLRVTLPHGATATGQVTLKVTSNNPKVAKPVGSAVLLFGKGKPTSQVVTLELGKSVGSATLTLSDVSGKLAPIQVKVVLSPNPPVSWEVLVPPYIQPGQTQPGDKTDSVSIAWQTVTLSEGGPDADHFVFSWRPIGSKTWKTAKIQPPTDVGSPTWQRHVVQLDGLAPGGKFEYRLVHVRNGNQVPGGSWLYPFQSRKIKAFRFTAFGNSGMGNMFQMQVAEQLNKLDTDLHLLLGDFVYDKGEYEHYPSRVFTPHEVISRSRLMTYTPGNHDVVKDNGAAIFANLLAPDNGPKGIQPGLYFTFDYGTVRFFSIFTGDQGLNLHKVTGWLAAGLAASTQPWNVVLTHELPLQRDPFGIDRKPNEAVRKLLLATAIQGKANLLIAGAAHSWQRYLPIVKVPSYPNSADSAPCAQGQGTTLVYPGTGGWARDPLKPIPGNLATPLVSYVPKRGIGVFDVDDHKMTISMVDWQGKVHDKVTISSCKKGGCTCP